MKMFTGWNTRTLSEVAGFCNTAEQRPDLTVVDRGIARARDGAAAEWLRWL